MATPTKASGRDEGWNASKQCLACLQILLDSYPASVAVLDRQGTIRCVNRPWRRFARSNGLKGDQVGVNYLKFCRSVRGPSAQQASMTAKAIRALLARRINEFSLEYPCHSPHKQRWFQMRLSPLTFRGCRAVMLVNFDITQRKLAELALQESHRQLLHAREEERRHIARELHDNIAQRLFAVEIGLENVLGSPKYALPPEARTAIDKAIDACGRLLRDARRLSHLYFPATLETLGLPTTLEKIAVSHAKALSVKVRCDRNIRQVRLTSPVEVAVFRIAQEALSHAANNKAREVVIKLGYRNRGLHLQVSDNGVRFDPLRSGPRDIGLTSMRERAEAVGGRMTISSRRGWTVVGVRIADVQRGT